MTKTGNFCSQIATKLLEDGHSKSHTHRVLEFDRNSIRFLVKEMVNSRKLRPMGKFVIKLDEGWCDCGKFQTIHLPRFHVLIACKQGHHDFKHVHQSTL